MRVWIDQDLCTGDGLCVEIESAVFVLEDDGLAYVRGEDGVIQNPGGAAHTVEVPTDCEPGVIESAEECPGECIFITE